MSIRRVFPSLQRADKYAYAYDSEAWSGNAHVHIRFRMFETYGDGLCQHSGDWSIAREFMPDYLASLATAMLADEDLTNAASYELLRGPTPDQIAFAASVTYKESDGDYSKRRWFSVDEKKISSSRSKEHDKRYQEITRIYDGSPNAIYRMLLPEYANALEMYAWAESIRNWILADPDYAKSQHYMPLAAEFLDWTKDRRVAQDFRHAFGACVCVARAYQMRSEAETHLHNIRPAEPKAEEAEADHAA